MPNNAKPARQESPFTAKELKQIAELNEDQVAELRATVSALLERSRVPHPEWCHTDFIDGDGDIVQHRSAGYSTIRKTPDAALLSAELSAYVDEDDLSWWAVQVQLTLDAGSERLEAPLTAGLEIEAAEAAAVLLEELVRMARAS